MLKCLVALELCLVALELSPVAQELSNPGMKSHQDSLLKQIIYTSGGLKYGDRENFEGEDI